MLDSVDYVRLPDSLVSENPLVSVAAQLNEEQFAARQIEFVQHLFGYCAFLRERSHAMPVSDAFLLVFVTLIEILELNSPKEASRYATEVQRILQVLFPDLDITDIARFGGLPLLDEANPPIDGAASRYDRNAEH